MNGAFLTNWQDNFLDLVPIFSYTQYMNIQ
jgi:hypothetical protein